MRLTFQKFNLDTDVDKLATWLSSQAWPFHVQNEITPGKVRSSIQSGQYSGEANQTFWILNDQHEFVGLLRLFEMDDLDDGSPLFDLRILNRYQRKGIGKAAVLWMTGYLFDNWPSLNRIEGTTRADNHAMRKVFHQCAFAKEAHYRQSWPGANGKLHDTVRYAILRADWKTGTSTPVDWNDEQLGHN